jgi:hydroxyacid-oxoacid transhydrogenase
MAVAVSAPSVFRATAASSPERHLEAAALLGASGGDPAEAGAALATAVIELMRALAIPNGIRGVGYAAGDVAALVDGAAPQQRLLANAPIAVGEPELASLFSGALEYW